MLLNNEQLLSSSQTISSYVTTNAAKDVTFLENEARQRNQEQWGAAIDTLLTWMRRCGDGGQGVPTPASIRSAVDFAADSRDNASMPTSIALTGDGGVAFEWRLGDEVVTIEIVASGLAEFTRFRKGRVVQEAFLKRNPKTRRLELRGSERA